MSDDYEVGLRQMQERDKLIIGHFVHTWRGRISDDALYQHVVNIEYFVNGHLNYSADADELRSLDQVTGWKVYDFITDWLPRKGLVTSFALPPATIALTWPRDARTNGLVRPMCNSSGTSTSGCC